MDPPPPPASLQQPPPPTVPPHLNYSDSIDSSPRSRNTDSWDDSTAATTKLRLMCSYGGHIVPRPHDKSLCYVGGDTRIVVADRLSSLSDLSARLAKTLLNGRPFTLKYQLPNEDLDSLISVTTDEDLDNMIDEYDRTANSPKPSRLRLFLFPSKPEASQSIGPILDNSVKSDDWFLNALNGAGMLNRGFSDSASVNCLLGLDDDAIANNNNPNNLDAAAARADVEASQPGSFGNTKNVKQDVHSVPDSPMLETTSSFGSTSSSPSLANLPPIRVHVEDASAGGMRMQDQRLGIEEQFAQIGVSGGQKQDEGFMVLSSPPPMPTTIAAVAMSSGLVAGEYANRVVSDDERSDHGVPVGYRKPPAQQLQAQPQTLPPLAQQKPSGGIDLPSPDSVSSDGSIANAMSRAKPVIYQEQLVPIQSGARVSANPVDPNARVQIQQQVVQDPGYMLQQQFDQQQQQQQQFVHPGAHYIQHHPGGVPMQAYYPLYPSQQQQHHHHHQQLDQQYPVYYMPARPGQAYNMSMQQPNINEAPTAIPSSRPQTPPSPAMVQPSAAYNPMRNAPMAAKPELAGGMYRTAAAGAPQLVQVPSSQHQHQQQQHQHQQQQQQYVGYSQMQYPSQSVAPTTAPANYAYEYAEPAHAHAQIYYTQPLAPTISAAQYQTMTGAAAVVLPDGSSAQHPKDAVKQQIRTSQAI